MDKLLDDITNAEKYIDDILDKSIFDYLNDRYNNHNLLYEKKFELLKTTKIKDIRINPSFDVYNYASNKSNNDEFKKLEELKMVLIKNSISNFNNLNETNVKTLITTTLENIINSYCNYNKFDWCFFTLNYIQNKTVFDHEKKIKELSLKVACQDDIIETLIINNQDLIIKLENQEKQIKELSSNTTDNQELISKIETFENMMAYNETKTYYKFVYLLYAFVVCIIYKII